MRKTIGPLTGTGIAANDEINTNTGQFTSANGIIKTIDKLRVTGFDYSRYSYYSNCGWVTTGPIAEGTWPNSDQPQQVMLEKTVSARFFKLESLRELQNRLSSALGTKVTLKHGKKGGTVTIHYYSQEELDAIVNRFIR